MDFSFFLEDNKSGYKTSERWLSKNKPDLYKKIIDYSLELPLTLSFKEKIWFFYNTLQSRPKCISCGGEIKFRERFDKPYGEFCSLVCINTNKTEMIERQKKTFNKKYSVDFYPQHKEFVEKQKKTKKLKYGDENYNNCEKGKKTKLQKYGDENFNNLIKQKKTIKEKYGSENISQTNWYKKFVLKQLKDKYPDINIVDNENQIIKIFCEKCNSSYDINKQLLYERYKRNYELCTICSPVGIKSRSEYEKEINEFLISIGIDTKVSYRGLPNKKEIDILIPEKNIGIEVNGVYWHNELYKNNDYHLNKQILCENENITLIQIFEDEWIYKKDIVKSILQNRVGKTKNKIFSRKCEIKEITSKESKTFLDENHIQGNVNSKVRIGLFFEQELVSLMCFSKGRIIMGGKEDEWEMTRFCNKKEYNVIGSASKLLKVFEKKYKPKKIISYSDKRWFDGKMYEKLGFKKISESKPNYWYVINDLRQHRFNYRKSILVSQGYDRNKTEKEIMFERKIYRIYDCGNIRWEYYL